jgi:hypothetical protein
VLLPVGHVQNGENKVICSWWVYPYHYTFFSSSEVQFPVYRKQCRWYKKSLAKIFCYQKACWLFIPYLSFWSEISIHVKYCFNNAWVYICFFMDSKILEWVYYNKFLLNQQTINELPTCLTSVFFSVNSGR